MNHRRRLLAVPLLSTIILGACGDDDNTAATTTTAATSEGVLKAAGCPDTVVIQTDWFPESEHGATYQLMGPDYVASQDAGSVTGPLHFQGEDTGVKLEIRGGGPMLGEGTVVSQMYQDPNILLGYVTTDEAIKNSLDFPTVAVVAPQNISPQIIMWDADKHPDATTIADIAAEVDRIAVFGGGTYYDYLIAEGIIPADKLDKSYQGDQILVGEGDTAAHQGFITAEPFKYANLDDPITTGYQLVSDTGWDPYPEALAIRTDKLEANRSCLAALVPMFQQAQIDYLADHAAADAVIIDFNNTIASFWQYTQEDADNSVQGQLDFEIVANGNTPALGDMENDRVTAFIAKAVPIFEAQGIAMKADLTVADITNNEFIDESITLAG